MGPAASTISCAEEGRFWSSKVALALRLVEVGFDHGALAIRRVGLEIFDLRTSRIISSNLSMFSRFLMRSSGHHVSPPQFFSERLLVWMSSCLGPLGLGFLPCRFC